MDENLVRIGDILTELEAQIGPLERQSEKARKYLALYGDMKQLDINLSVIALDKNAQDTEKTNAQYKSVEDELASIRSKETENERIMNDLYEESRKSDEDKTATNAGLVENEAKISSTKNEITILENNIKNNTSSVRRIEGELANIDARNDERRELIEKTEAEIVSKTEEAGLITSELSGARSATEEYEAGIAKVDEEISGLRTEYFSRENEITSENERVNGIETLRNSFIERREAVYAEIASHKESVEETKKQIEETSLGIETRKDKLSGLSETVTDLNNSKADAESELAVLQQKLNSMRVEHDSKSSKKRILEGLENDYAGYAKSVKAVLTAPELKRLSIHGTVSGLAEVDKKYVQAIETALGGALQNIIVESEEDAKQAIAHLRKTGGGRATFLPITSVKGKLLDNVNQVSKSKGYIGIASELIRYDKRYDGIFKSLLGRVVVVDNIDNAIALSREFGYRFKTVTLEGDVLNAGGSMSGGSVNKQSGFLSRAAEIKTLTADISALVRDIKSAEEKTESLMSDISLVDNQLSSFVPLVREYEDEILKLENTLRMLNESLEKSSESGYEAELMQIESHLKDSADEVAKLIAHVSSLKTKNSAVEKQIQDLFDSRNELLAKKAEAAEESGRTADRVAEINKDIALCRQSVDTAKAEIEASKDELASRKANIEEINKLTGEYEKQIEAKKETLVNIEKLSEEMREKLRTIDEQKAAINEKMQRFRGDGKDITNTIIELQQELSRIENKRLKLQADRDNTLNRLWDDYELAYDTAVEMKTEVENIKEASETLADLKKKIKNLGSVNMDAIEEYRSVKERYEFMSSQKADLEKSKDNLRKIIDSMEELMREHFGEQFTEINKAFSEVFTELFGGGRGRLYLSEPDNILTSGIEIEVQLPGKGLQNLNLYSGGERSFIAIALLFAILKVKPTPFCILDEIDAALDDVNVSRFATYLKNYVDRTQFIIITHRRGSMEAASILYGVTMQESGVSKLLSLKIDDVADELIE